MKLGDLRRLSVRRQSRIHFRMRNGMECVITEDGIAQVPGIKSVPDFNIEEELESAGEFLLEPVPDNSKSDKRSQPKPHRIGRQELAQMVSASPAFGSPHPQEED